MLKSTPTDPLEKGVFNFKNNGMIRKNASVEAREMGKPRQINEMRKDLLDYSINQSQKNLAL